MRTLISAAVLAATMVTPQTAAQAYCVLERGAMRYPSSDNVRHSIPVYLYAPNGTFLGANAGLYENSIYRAVDWWFERSAARVRFYYAGRTTSTDDNGRVVIREYTAGMDACDTFPERCFVENIDYSPLFNIIRSGGTVWFPMPSGIVDYSRSPDFYMRVLVHELGHALGLDDLYTKDKCGDYAGIMSSGTRDITMDDKTGLQALYGPGFFPLFNRVSDDGGLSWQQGSAPNGYVPVVHSALGSVAVGQTWERFAASHHGTMSTLESVCDQPYCDLSAFVALTSSSEGAPALTPDIVARAASWERLAAGDSARSVIPTGLVLSQGKVRSVGTLAPGSEPWAVQLDGVEAADQGNVRTYTADLGVIFPGQPPPPAQPGPDTTPTWAWSDVMRTRQLTALQGSGTWYPIAMAQRSPSAWLLAWVGGDTPSSAIRTVRYAITRDGGASYAWQGEIQVPNPLLSHPIQADSATYDPTFDRYYLALYSYKGAHLVALPATAPPPSVVTASEIGIAAVEAPEIACASDGQCMMTWLGNDHAYPLRWTTFRGTATGGFEIAAPRVAMTLKGWMSAPTLVATKNTSHPFIMAGEKPGFIETRRWSRATETWGDPRTVVSVPKTTSILRPRITRIDRPTRPSRFVIRYSSMGY